ncbi:MAG: hypothetical protein RLZ97_959, partial [Verrucomicrobiota bacterium]
MRSRLLCLLALLPLTAPADDLDFAEKFADPATRVEALATLVPGTRDAYFHLALHQQLTGDTAGFTRTINEWRAASTRKNQPVSPAGIDTLTTREILIRFQSDPEENLAALIRTLDLDFDDAR